MDENLKKEIAATVAEIFSAKEEAERRQQTEDALSKSAEIIKEMTASLEAKITEGEDLASKMEEIVSQLEASVKEKDGLNVELEAANTKLGTLNDELTAAKTEIERMKRDQVIIARISELDEAKVLGKDIESTKAKLREMSDEEFAAYKGERVALREAVLAELSTKTDSEEKEAAKEEKKETKEEAKEETKEEAKEETKEEAKEESASNDELDLTTIPAELKGLGHSLSAALNFEVLPSDDIITKYNKLGQAMAEQFKQGK